MKRSEQADSMTWRPVGRPVVFQNILFVSPRFTDFPQISANFFGG